MDLLVEVAVVAHHAVMQTVVRVFGAYAQVAFGAPARVGEAVLQTRDGRQVGTAPVGRGVPARAEIALAPDMLDRRIGGDEMTVVLREPVECQLPGVDVMTQLLGDIGLVGLERKAVAAATEVRRMVVLCSDLTVRAGLEERTRAGGRGAHLGHLAEPVPVAVIRAACTVAGEDISAYLAVLA